MLIRDLLSVGRINPGIEASSRNDALAVLVDMMIADRAYPKPFRKELMDMLLEREDIQTSGIENGVAIPHVPSHHVTRITGAFGIMKEPLTDWTSTDGSPIRYILLLVAPEDSFRMHVKSLWSAARLFGNLRTLAAIRQSRSPEDILRVISNAETQQEFAE